MISDNFIWKITELKDTKSGKGWTQGDKSTDQPQLRLAYYQSLINVTVSNEAELTK